MIKYQIPIEVENTKEYCMILSTVPPKVQLELGSTLRAENIKEGDDVYFECKVRANPEHHKITWRHNVSLNCLLFYIIHFTLILYTRE